MAVTVDDAPSVDRSGLAALIALRDSLNSSIDRLIESADAVPSLDSFDDVLARPSATAIEAAATAKGLVALLQGWTGVIDASFAFHLTSSLRVAVDAHVVEALVEGKKNGKAALHVDEIAKASTIDPAKLARILRLLTAHHIFREVEPNVFANNRRSIILDTGKSIAELKSNNDWFSGTNGIAACTTLLTNEGLRASGYVADTLFAPSTSHSYSPAETPFAMAKDAKVSAFDMWYRENGAADRERFGAAMAGMAALLGKGDKGYPFELLPVGATVVDVGSGVGAISLGLSKSAPQVTFVLEDLPGVIDGPTTEFWQKQAPKELINGRVKLVSQDFFSPQTVKSADVYLLSQIVHDWPDSHASQILSHLSEAAGPTSRLIIIESPYDYLITPSVASDRNLFNPYFVDLQMLVLLNGQERTEEQYKLLAEKAGWKFVKVWKTGVEGRDGSYRHYEFEPVAVANGGMA
ncbi:hypothetical protein JCM11641_007791 [Rhodosporidiobolus odoratus]